MARQVGSKNKRTLYREAKEKTALAAPVLKAAENRLTPFDMIGESLNVMGECLGVFIDYARSISADDPAKMAERLEAYDHALHAAAMLAPYRYPKFATIKVSADDPNKEAADDDVSYDAVLADLAEHMRRTGVKPSKMMDRLNSPSI
jgi:hypothetical protein